MQSKAYGLRLVTQLISLLCAGKKRIIDAILMLTRLYQINLFY
jgi:hypothetical protein